MADDPIIPDPNKPEIKPEVIPPVTPEPPTKLEKQIAKNEMVVSKQGYNEMQKSLLALQKKDEDNEKEKLELEKTNLLNQLVAINPKYAELHKNSNKDMLVGALATAQAEANSFTELNKGKGKDDTKPDSNNFTSVKYDWTLHKNKEDKDPWQYM